MRATTRKPARVARAARAARAAAYRTRYIRLSAAAARPLPPAPVLVRDGDLTGDQRDMITEALRATLRDHSGEVPYRRDIEVAYHAGWPLAALWLIFQATDSEIVIPLFAVLDKLGVAIDPAHWDDGWSDYHEKWSVPCPSCNTVNYGRPGGDLDERLSRGVWPDVCECGAYLDTPHHTEIVGEGTVWFAGCTCEWGKGSGAPDYRSEAAAKGQVTRHLRRVAAAE